MGTGVLGVRWLLVSISMAVFFLLSLLWAYVVSPVLPMPLTIVLLGSCLFFACLLLFLRLFLPRSAWLKAWLCLSPFLLSSSLLIPHLPLFPGLPLLFLFWCLLSVWGAAHFYPFLLTAHLHKARFARIDEVSPLLSRALPTDGLLMGTHKYSGQVAAVRPTKRRRELGNLLVVAPTRGGKGLLAISQLLTFGHSMVVNDIKGELFAATAGYRATLGDVYVLDPKGVGHTFDPLRGKTTEDALYSLSSHLLFEAEEKERIFTDRASVMLTQLFLAARKEGVASFPYARFLIRLGLTGAANRLNAVDPTLATQFLESDIGEANLTDRFLISCWGTLTTRLRPLLTETVVRSLTGSDFTPEMLMRSPRPVTVYLRWPEQDLLALSPLVRLLWGSLINELITTYDHTQGAGCKPVLLLVDEAGKTAIPSLSDQATTVVGRGISLLIFVQSLSQLETIYGKARGQTLKDNMDTQLYYPPTDLVTAKYLEESLGSCSAFAHSTTSRAGTDASIGLSERPIPLLTAQEIKQLNEAELIGFHRHLPPLRLRRMDWRGHPTLISRRSLKAPHLPILPPLAELPICNRERPKEVFIDPDILA